MEALNTQNYKTDNFLKEKRCSGKVSVQSKPESQAVLGDCWEKTIKMLRSLVVSSNKMQLYDFGCLNGFRNGSPGKFGRKVSKLLIQDPPQWLLPVEELKPQDPSLSSIAPLLS